MAINRAKLKRGAVAAVLTAAIAISVSVWTAPPSEGASVPRLETIRVALFINVPGKYSLKTSAATFTANELQIGMRTPAAIEPWFTAGSDPIRISIDDYKAKLIETTTFTTAQSIQKRLNALGGSAVITSQSKSGKTVFVVAEGSYSTAAEAKTALDKWSTDGTISSLLGKTKGIVMGPLHLESGRYASESEARKVALQFASAGLDAYPVIRSTGGKTVYSVMVGSAADAAALSAIKGQAAKVSSSIALHEADSSSPYLLIRDDHTVTGTAKSSYRSFSFPAGSAKVWLSTDGSKGISLKERSEQTYRGSFEASAYNGKLAIINELPFEQYLYSVVPSEMPASWPAEALKSQAVAARSYALYQGLGFGIAHVNDTELSQVYKGIGAEKESTTSAVKATEGQVALYNGKPIEALFSSNAGGQTADATEIWGNAVSYLKSVPSPDQSAEKNLKRWYKVAIPAGRTGYIREDLLKETGKKNPVGAVVMATNTDNVNVRLTPVVDDKLTPIAKLASGTEVVVLGKVVESNTMSWVKGPYSAEDIMKSAGLSSPVRTLEATFGPSGRVIAMEANGSPLTTKSPINYRTLMGGLPSTRFTIDETARVTVLGANGATSERPNSPSTLYIQGAAGTSQALSSTDFYIADGDGNVRAATRDPQFYFNGYGNGHGVGLSQYGALGLAQLGYDYAYILKYYYKDITIEGQ
ncbi:SpoIID/LytB domain-containing protein [Paenibacillus xylaniclasticus]|uniref:SpoIID/LytB domain-containing protein n=1 Tax=Paenibacillus xylaniclasticus TaxID=588083 RepID=UPI00175D9529|nr:MULTISPECIES: SpoIID/LytB domain-containing protein [Paenibacillus]GFN33605.1 hypothetical protein PCURB6_38650 [Paenibacillus curdlanolyticus]